METEQTLTRKQFDFLHALTKTKDGAMTQRQLEKETGYSLGTVNKLGKELTALGYVENGRITAEGLEALEPYRAKRAIFIAAGFGTRLVPVTLNTPKPLVRVNGKRIIDGLIDACLAVGIHEIYIVRGYLAEQFDQLLYKYPMIKFLENPSYNESNNISSAVCARYLMSNAYVFEADLLLRNPAIITKYHYTSNYLGIPMERSNDWCFEVSGGVIKSLQIGGLNCYQEVGVSYWDEAAGKKLSNHLLQAYEMPGGKERFWDMVPLSIFAEEYQVEVRECRGEDIVEIDTFNELKAIDKTYDTSERKGYP